MRSGSKRRQLNHNFSRFITCLTFILQGFTLTYHQRANVLPVTLIVGVSLSTKHPTQRIGAKTSTKCLNVASSKLALLDFEYH